MSAVATPGPLTWAAFGCSGYHRSILQATGCANEDLEAIEELMRGQHRGVLDHLNATQFRRCAQQSWLLLQELRVSQPRFYPTPAYAPPEPATQRLRALYRALAGMEINGITRSQPGLYRRLRAERDRLEAGLVGT